MKIYIVSDIHLVPPGETSKGIDTTERLDAALADLAANHGDADLCVLLGDLADHGAESAYRTLADRLARVSVPVIPMLGNHDDRLNFHRVFPDAPRDENGFVQTVRDTAQGRLIFLDTFEHDYVDGHLCAHRLAWLAARLDEAKDRPVVVFLHHPPFDIGMRVDKIGLRQRDELHALLAAHGDVRHIVSGHTHRACSGVWRGIPFFNVGATHYNQGVVLGRPGQVARYLFPISTAVALLREDGLVIHHIDVSPTRIAMAPQLFPEKRVEEIIARAGRISA